MNNQGFLISKVEMLTVPKRFIIAKGLLPGEKLLYILMCDECDGNLMITKTQEYFADMLNTSVNSIRKYTRSLEAKGFLKRHLKHDGSRPYFTYQLIFPLY